MNDDRRKDVKLRKALNKLQKMAENYRIVNLYGADFPNLIWNKPNGDRKIIAATVVHLDVLTDGNQLVCIAQKDGTESYFGLIDPLSNYLFTELSISELAQVCDRYSLIKAKNNFKYFLNDYEFNQKRKRT